MLNVSEGFTETTEGMREEKHIATENNILTPSQPFNISPPVSKERSRILAKHFTSSTARLPD
jgi:hypothetical protein